MQTTDIEKENLESHVEICALRYKGLEERIANLELQLVDVRDTLANIQTAIEDLRQDQDSRWSQLQVAVIGLLMGVVGFLAVSWIQTL